MVETATGADAKIISVRLSERMEYTYNFTVADTHTYLVGRTHVVVHNCKAIDELGRALQKKMGRPGSGFPKVKGPPTELNREAKEIYDNIVANGNKVTRHHAKFGDVIEFRLPGVGGVRLGIDGKFIGFLEVP